MSNPTNSLQDHNPGPGYHHLLPHGSASIHSSSHNTAGVIFTTWIRLRLTPRNLKAAGSHYCRAPHAASYAAPSLLAQSRSPRLASSIYTSFLSAPNIPQASSGHRTFAYLSDQLPPPNSFINSLTKFCHYKIVHVKLSPQNKNAQVETPTNHHPGQETTLPAPQKLLLSYAIQSPPVPSQHPEFSDHQFLAHELKYTSLHPGASLLF